MNNFDGQIKLYPEICIDNFSSDVLFGTNKRCFILTHFHDDHMKNLEDVRFYNMLRSSDGAIKFFCSQITRKFIETCDKYSHLTDYCNEISCESPFVVKLSDMETVTITFCGAGHCPGSIMAFIEGSRGNVLFTGDFRLPLNCASRLVFFKKDTGCLTFENDPSSNDECNLKKVDDLYIDMTFFKPDIKLIPTREESVKVLLRFINECLNSNKQNRLADNGLFKNYIYLKTSARIGYEFVYQEIYRNTGYKVHVSELIYKIYDQLPVIQSSLTLDPYETPIHNCIYENNRRKTSCKSDLMKSSFPFKNCTAKESGRMSDKNLSNIKGTGQSEITIQRPILPCLRNEKNEQQYDKTKINASKVILSTMWFTQTAGVNQIFVEYKPNKTEINSAAYKPYTSIYRLCFSFHSSFEEIIDFVNTIKPKKIYSIALPESTSDKTINNYFYNSDGLFQGFRLDGHSNCDSEYKRFISFNEKDGPIKRKSIESFSSCSKSYLQFNKSSSSSDNDSATLSPKSNDRADSDGSLKFHDSDDEIYAPQSAKITKSQV